MNKPSPRRKPDGYWHAYVTVGVKANGRPDQRHVKRKTKEEAEERIEELVGQRTTGKVVRPGRVPTVQAWLTTYLDRIAPLKVDPTTVQGYRSKMRCYVYPVIGTIRMDRLTPEHLDDVYLAMARQRRADSTRLQVHRILYRALEVAFRRGVCARNVADLIDPPTAKKIEITPLSEAEALRILDAAENRRNSARWSVGLALGLRQGEALGLRWSYVNLEAGEMRVWWQLHRRSWEHGCGGTCGRRRGGNCPQRELPMRSGEIQIEGLILKEPKGKGKRTIPIPPELVEPLRAHKEVQDLENMVAEGTIHQYDLVFARPDGGPIDPSTDWQEWKDLLRAAGVRDARVHDGRHTAATLMLAQGVKTRVAQEILGHSSSKVTEGYQHVASAMAREATQRMGESLLRKRSTP